MPLTRSDFSRLRALRDKKHREDAGLFVIEGEKVVGELLAAHCPLLEIYATPEWSGRAGRLDEPRLSEEERGLQTHFEPVPGPGSTKMIPITTEEMARASHFPTPSTVLAVGKIARTPLNPDALGHGLTLALDGIQDPGNVGTLLRVADWFALDRVLLSPDCADLFSQKVINASMGSFARLTVHTAALPEALAGCPAPILGCDLQGEEVHALRPMRDAVLVIGSEGRGISEAVRPLVTSFVTIPRFGAKGANLGGGAESLNAAIAAAIVCDNLRRVSG